MLVVFLQHKVQLFLSKIHTFFNYQLFDYSMIELFQDIELIYFNEI